MCGLAPALYRNQSLNDGECVNEHPDMPEAFKTSYTIGPGPFHANALTIARLCEAPAVISFPPRQRTTHRSSAGDERRDQTSFCNPLGPVLYSADWLASCATKRGPACRPRVRLRTRVRAAEADRPFRVAPVPRRWLSGRSIGVEARVELGDSPSTLVTHLQQVHAMAEIATALRDILHTGLRLHGKRNNQQASIKKVFRKRIVFSYIKHQTTAYEALAYPTCNPQ